MTLIGLITILVGLWTLVTSPRGLVTALILATLLGSAAALLIGSASIQPAHVFLAFVAFGIVPRRREYMDIVRTMSFPQPGFWLVCAVAYGIVCGMYLPKILQGTSQIIPVGSTGYEDTGSAVPLGPTSGNFTQAIYMVADLACFVMVRAIASRTAGLITIAKAVTIFTIANIGFAFIDLATFQTGTAWTLDFIRNAQYTFHTEESTSGLKRIVGSFLEASSFAHATLGALGFTGTLWLFGQRPLLNGTLALISLVLLVMSTSSTGFIGTPVLLSIFYFTLFFKVLKGTNRHRDVAILVIAPIALTCAIFGILLSPNISAIISDYANTLVFSKSSSQSGVERASWNALAWSNFIDSYGLGVGLGTNRASSLALAILSNLGLPGASAYAMFLLTSLLVRRPSTELSVILIQSAARNAAFALLIADILSGTLVDQGLFFYILAAVASAHVLPERARERAMSSDTLTLSPRNIAEALIRPVRPW